MCGIAGCGGSDRERIERMTHALIHRGPDGNAVEVLEDACLGHARLAILDPRPEGDQPMWNAEKTIAIVYNGEIYNYKKLRDEEQIRCRTGTDTEVLLHLYERYGMAFLPRLRGMFAFGIYDTRDRAWRLARDESGIKPLYVHTENGDFAFASEVRSILAGLAVKPALNTRSLSRYMRLQYVPGPETMCEGIESLPPGTTLTVKDGRITRTTFVSNATHATFPSQSAFKRAFPALMQEVVTDHLVSDRPLGIFLSGGMDSSIILHHAAQATAGRVKTFTIRFDATEEEGAKRFNADAELANLTAEHYGTDHTEILLTAADQHRLYRETVRSLDQPNADTVSVAQYLLSKIAKESVDVALTGAGGDELFGGYPRYRIAKLLARFERIPPTLRSLGARVVGYPQDVAAMSPGAVLAERLLARPSEEIRTYVRGTWFDGAPTTTLFGERYPTTIKDPVRAFMEFDRTLWLVDESLRLADGTSMGSGLEARVPFLDPRIIAASHASRAAWHVSGSTTKALLKDTYRSILPPHLFSLKKASFYPPMAKWLRRESSALIDEALEQPRMKEFFDLDALRRIAAEHKEKHTYHLHTLSSVIQLAHWFDAVYDV